MCLLRRSFYTDRRIVAPLVFRFDEPLEISFSQVVVNISKRYGKLPVSLLALLVVTYTIFGLLRTVY